MSIKGWEVKKETDTADEKAQAYKELERWEFILRVTKSSEKRELAKKRVEYWKRLI